MFKKLISILLFFLFVLGNTMHVVTSKTISEMTLDEKIGHMICLDFKFWANDNDNENKPVTEINDTIREIIANYHIGSVILFSQNFSNKDQAKKLISDLQRAAKSSTNPPLIIAVDQEGGKVERFKFDRKENFESNAYIKSPEGAYQKGEAIAKELKELGINCNFAPVADVNSNPENTIIGERSFSDKAEIVAEHCESFLKGLHSQNIMGTAKHFPGHGDTSKDSHFELPTVNKTLSELKQLELKPFKKLIDVGIDLIMTAHIELPQIEEKTVISEKDGLQIYLPATLSKKILTNLLRKKLKFEGVIVTDAMDMKAISDNFGAYNAVKMAIIAGADIVCMPVTLRCSDDEKKLESLFAYIKKAVKDGEITEEQINKSVERILKLKKKYLY